MNLTTTQSIPGLNRRPRRPRPAGTDARGHRAQAKRLPTPQRAGPAVSGIAPADGELPLLCEIADQLQQHTTLDRTTAIGHARVLLERAFRSLHEADIPVNHSDLESRFT